METGVAPDRRKTRRYRYHGGALAVFKPEPLQLGQLVDIGMGGMSVRCIQTQYGRPADYTILTLLLGLPDKAIENIPIRTVAEFKVEDGVRDGKIVYHRCLAFGALNPEQQSAISRFIRDHASREAEDRRCRPDRRSGDEERKIAVKKCPGQDRRETEDRRGGRAVRRD